MRLTWVNQFYVLTFSIKQDFRKGFKKPKYLFLKSKIKSTKKDNHPLYTGFCVSLVLGKTSIFFRWNATQADNQSKLWTNSVYKPTIRMPINRKKWLKIRWAIQHFRDSCFLNVLTHSTSNTLSFVRCLGLSQSFRLSDISNSAFILRRDFLIFLCF